MSVKKPTGSPSTISGAANSAVAVEIWSRFDETVLAEIYG
jgi:hypothetical protein